MKNNKIGKIQIQKSGVPINRFNLPADSHTTFGFGECQPSFYQEMLPNSSCTLQKETLALLAPMVAPTMGRMSLETFGIFVPKKDVIPCYDEFLSKTRFNYGAYTFVPQHLPQVRQCVLSSLVLFGARASIFKVLPGAGAQESYHAVDSNAITNFINAVRSGDGNNTFMAATTLSGYGLSIPSCRLLPFKNFLKRIAGTYNTSFISGGIPLYNSAGTNVLTPFVYDENDTTGTSHNVRPDNCDFILHFDVVINGSTETYAFCLNCSAFGKRIHKILLGMGYEINFNSDQLLDVTPLLAWFKGYFDIFGLLQWSNWQDTACCNFINSWLADSCPADVAEYTAIWLKFLPFVVELGRCWFTDEQDYISAHQANVSNAGFDTQFRLNSFIDVTSNGSDNLTTASNNITSPNGLFESNSFWNDHAYIDKVFHGELDSKLLKRIYKWTNRNSVIGMRVAELLRAQGHGDWIDANKSNFIGHWSVPLKVSNVVSQSDTYEPSTDTGSLLGEYGGRGIGYDENSSMSYRTTEAGYFICISVVVPKSGYVGGLDLTRIRDIREDEYQPEFDGLGMEISPKAVVYDRSDIARSYDINNSAALSFGFIPRSTKYKVKKNINSGNFALRSYRNAMIPYTLDKMMLPGDIQLTSKTKVQNMELFNFIKSSFDYDTMPVAGNSWRYPTRYPWISNFARIFAVQGQRDGMPHVGQAGWITSSDIPEIVLDDYDNFIVHMVDNVRYYAHMLPIEASYETKEDGNEGKTDMVVSKA